MVPKLHRVRGVVAMGERRGWPASSRSARCGRRRPARLRETLCAGPLTAGRTLSVRAERAASSRDKEEMRADEHPGARRR